MKKINAGNLLSGIRSSALITGLFVVLVVSIVLLFANFAYLNTQSNYDKEYISHAGELRVLSQRIAKNATEAAAGKSEAFPLLKEARNDFEKRWNILLRGDEESGLPPAPDAVSMSPERWTMDMSRYSPRTFHMVRNAQGARPGVSARSVSCQRLMTFRLPYGFFSMSSMILWTRSYRLTVAP